MIDTVPYTAANDHELSASALPEGDPREEGRLWGPQQIDIVPAIANKLFFAGIKDTLFYSAAAPFPSEAKNGKEEKLGQ